MKFYLISGNDELAVKARSKAIIQELCGEDYREFNGLEIIRGDDSALNAEAMLGTLLNALRTPPFLTDSKVIWWRNVTVFDELSALCGAKDASGDIFNKIGRILNDETDDSIALVIDGGVIDQRKQLYKLFKNVPNGQIEILRKAELGAKDFVRNQLELIRKSCQDNGKRISHDAADFLLSAVGSDYGRLQNELAKIFCYLDNDTEITLAVCRNVCSLTPENLNWDFGNALMDGDASRALEVVKSLMVQMRAQRGGNLELAMVTSAWRSFQELLRAKAALCELNAPLRLNPNYFSGLDNDFKSRFPDNFLLKLHPFRAYKVAERAGNFSDLKLAQIIEETLNASRNLVSGNGDAQMILEQLILKICENSHNMKK